MKGIEIYSKAMLQHEKLYERSSLAEQEKKDLYHQYFNLIKKAAYLGHKDAMYEYAQQFEDISYLGMTNPLFNPKRRNFWYLKAAESGHSEACNNLAYVYEIGDGLEKDCVKALDFYRKSAELGSYIGSENYKIMQRDMFKGGRYNK